MIASLPELTIEGKGLSQIQSMKLMNKNAKKYASKMGSVEDLNSTQKAAYARYTIRWIRILNRTTAARFG